MVLIVHSFGAVMYCDVYSSFFLFDTYSYYILGLYSKYYILDIVHVVFYSLYCLIYITVLYAMVCVAS